FVHTDVAAGGALAGISVSVPTAQIEGGTTASVDANITAGSAGVLVQATSANHADVEVFALAVGALAAAVIWGDAEITTHAITDSTVGSHAIVSAPLGDVQVFATSTNHVTS